MSACVRACVRASERRCVHACVCVFKILSVFTHCIRKSSSIFTQYLPRVCTPVVPRLTPRTLKSND